MRARYDSVALVFLDPVFLYAVRRLKYIYIYSRENIPGRAPAAPDRISYKYDKCKWTNVRTGVCHQCVEPAAAYIYAEKPRVPGQKVVRL